MGHIKVSVIMGVYGPICQKQFFRSVQSIVRQTLQEWELLLFDDGSSKETALIIKKAAALDKRIKYLRAENNKGLPAVLNKCILLSRGDYIARMDADDLSRKDRLEKQAQFLDQFPQYQWVGSNALLIDGRKIWGFKKMPAVPGKKDFLPYSPYIHPSVMFRKSVLKKNGGYREHSCYLQCEDYELFMRLHSIGYRGYNLPEPLLAYCENIESFKRRSYKRRIKESIVRMHGFRKLGMDKKKMAFYVAKPLLIGVIPGRIQYYLRKKIHRANLRENKKNVLQKKKQSLLKNS